MLTHDNDKTGHIFIASPLEHHCFRLHLTSGSEDSVDPEMRWEVVPTSAGTPVEQLRNIEEDSETPIFPPSVWRKVHSVACQGCRGAKTFVRGTIM